MLRGKNKLYLTDPAIAPAVLMRGKSILEDARALSQCVETAIIGHLCSHFSTSQARFSYWRNQKQKEVALILEMGECIVPFEIKYQSRQVQVKDIPGLINLCNQKPSILYGYIITKDPHDIGLLQGKPLQKKYIKIPACLFCYWLGVAEFMQKSILL